MSLKVLFDYDRHSGSPERPRHGIGHRTVTHYFATTVLLCGLSVGSAACHLFTGRESALNYDLPLTVMIRPGPSVTEAVLEYRNSCARPAVLKIDGMLTEALREKLGRVFKRVVLEPSSASRSIDGFVDVALGLKELDLYIPRKTDRSYPASVTLGLDFSYSDPDGAVRFSKKLQSQERDDVQVTKDSCDVKNLDAVVQQVVDKVVEGMAKQLGESSRIREAAQSPTDTRPRAESSAPVSAPAIATPPAFPSGRSGTPPAVAPPPAQTDLPKAPRDAGPTKLSFRTIIRDENRNQVLERQEHFTVEFEIKNDGSAVADDVEVHLSGHPAVIQNLKHPVVVGSVRPGEIRRVSVSGILGEVSEIEEAELVCSLRASSAVQLPASKKFLVAIRPETVDEVEVLSVDVDQLPKLPGKLRQPQAVGIAVGVGQFRDTAMPAVLFSGRDAEIMAKYFTTYVGVPATRVKLLQDEHVLKDDLVETFETWLPNQADQRTVVVVYFSGRAVVDAASGVVSLVPYDGSPDSPARLFSLARLQRALARAQVSQAILLLDVSLESTPGVDPSRTIIPAWTGRDGESEKDRFMWMIGNNSLQEAHAYQQGQHGLFTYYLLRGLRGAADLDKNGIVLSGELCTYAHRQVANVAKHEFGNSQEPVCLPQNGQASRLRQLPLSRQR